MLNGETKLSEPNELGYQFGINKSLTEYAHASQPKWGGGDMPSVDITVLEVWKDNKFEAYLLVDEKTNKELKDYTDFESAAVGIDQYKLAKKLK